MRARGAEMGASVDIDSAQSLSCLVGDDGTLWCCGYPLPGLGVAEWSSTALRIGTRSDFVQVSVHPAAGCARTSGGSVFCWGPNGDGQRGDGTLMEGPPSAVSGVSDAVDVSAGPWGGCAVRATGGVVCWGGDQFGNLGDGPSVPPRCLRIPCAYVPVTASGITTAVDVDVGWINTCARLADGRVFCWGDSRAVGDGIAVHGNRCGWGTEDCALSPMEVAGLLDATWLGHMSDQPLMCAGRATGGVTCWGTVLTPVAPIASGG